VEQLKSAGRGGSPDWRKIAQKLSYRFKPKQLRQRCKELNIVLPKGTEGLKTHPWTMEEVRYNKLLFERHVMK
jgi:hypothetical protein